MKERLRCKIFGHDFRLVDKDTDGIYDTIRIRASLWCRNCGLSKEDLK